MHILENCIFVGVPPFVHETFQNVKTFLNYFGLCIITHCEPFVSKHSLDKNKFHNFFGRIAVQIQQFWKRMLNSSNFHYHSIVQSSNMSPPLNSQWQHHYKHWCIFRSSTQCHLQTLELDLDHDFHIQLLHYNHG